MYPIRYAQPSVSTEHGNFGSDNARNGGEQILGINVLNDLSCSSLSWNCFGAPLRSSLLSIYAIPVKFGISYGGRFKDQVTNVVLIY